MRRVFHVVSLLLVALWLPATQHCALEAAGLFDVTCSDDCGAGSRDLKDGCATVEDGAYKAGAEVVRVSTPSLVAWVNLVCAYCVPVEVPDETASRPGESFDNPREWVSEWHFVRRAAPIPRAPSVFLA